VLCAGRYRSSTEQTNNGVPAMEHARTDHSALSLHASFAANLVLAHQEQGGLDPMHVTERQVEVLCFLAEGMTSHDVAERMMISHHTVARHVVNMMTAVGAANRLELLARAFIGGVVTLDRWPPRPTGSSIVRFPCD
jgi:DNA-binding NarL/FixJ family response regulator